MCDWKSLALCPATLPNPLEGRTTTDLFSIQLQAQGHMQETSRSYWKLGSTPLSHIPMWTLEGYYATDPHVLSSSAFSHLCSSSTLKPNLCTKLLNLLGQLEMCKKNYSLCVCLSCPRILPQSTWLSWVWKLLRRKVRKAHQECLLLSSQV